MTQWLWLPLAGGVAGFLAGLFGIGGGLLIVGVLALLLPALGIPDARVMHVALATSLASIVFTSISSTLAHHRRGAVLWSVVRALVPGLIAGGLAGGLLARYLSSGTLRVVFALFLMVIALRMATGYRPPPHRALPPRPALAGLGGLIGVLSAWTGIGGGSLTGPLLVWCNVDPRQAVASAAASGLPIALAATLGYVVGGWGEPGLPNWSSGYVWWPAVLLVAGASVVTAPLGARAAHSMPVDVLRRAFAALLAAVAIKLVFFS